MPYGRNFSDALCLYDKVCTPSDLCGKIMGFVWIILLTLPDTLPLPRATGEDLSGCDEGFHWIGTTLPRTDKGTASWYVIRTVPCFGVFRPSSLPTLAWLAAGEITAAKFSTNANGRHWKWLCHWQALEDDDDTRPRVSKHWRQHITTVTEGKFIRTTVEAG